MATFQVKSSPYHPIKPSNTPQTQSLEEIDPAGDLTLNIVEYDYSTYNANGEYPPLRTASFKVSRQTLLQVAGNDYWKRLLAGGFQEAGSNAITLKDDSIASMELWLRVLHGNLVEDSYLIPVEQIVRKTGSLILPHPLLSRFVSCALNPSYKLPELEI